MGTDIFSRHRHSDGLPVTLTIALTLLLVTSRAATLRSDDGGDGGGGSGGGGSDGPLVVAVPSASAAMKRKEGGAYTVVSPSSSSHPKTTYGNTTKNNTTTTTTTTEAPTTTTTTTTTPHEGPLKPGSPEFYMNVGICVTLVTLAGIFAGLTLGLLSYDPNTLQVIIEGGEPDKARYAKAVLPLVMRHHLLLVTLLLCNAGVNETLPLFLDDLLPSPIYAIIVSVTAVLMFGEVIPQAICSKHGLRIGAFFAPLVWLLMLLTLPVSYPLAKLLDLVLGSDHSAFFRRAELGALVKMHGAEGPSSGHNTEVLSPDEVTIIRAALDMESKCARDAMQPLDVVFCLPRSSGRLDLPTMQRILESGHSRVPLYSNTRGDMNRFLMVKNLITYAPDDATPLMDIPARTLMRVPDTMPLYDLLNIFQTGRGHIAVCVNAQQKAIGIITLEDVIEELIGEEIVDETDKFVDVARHVLVTKIRRLSTLKTSPVTARRAATLTRAHLERQSSAVSQINVDGLLNIPPAINADANESSPLLR